MVDDASTRHHNLSPSRSNQFFLSLKHFNHKLYLLQHFFDSQVILPSSMKFYQTPLLAFVSTALVLSLTSAPAASASSVFVKRSNLSNRFIQPQAYVQPLDVRTNANSEEVLGLEGYAQEQLQKVPPPTKTEIVAGLTKNLKKGTKNLSKDCMVSLHSARCAREIPFGSLPCY